MKYPNPKGQGTGLVVVLANINENINRFPTLAMKIKYTANFCGQGDWGVLVLLVLVYSRP